MAFPLQPAEPPPGTSLRVTARPAAAGRRPAVPGPCSAGRRRLHAVLGGLLALGLLSACAHRPQAPADTAWLTVPRWVSLERLDGTSGEQGMLAVQRLADGGLRWSWFNWLGAPRTRQILAGGRWRNDGFLPPDPQARRLFEALLLAWMPPGVRQAHERATGGRSEAAAAAGPDDTLLLETGRGERWRVRPLESRP